MLEQLVLHGVKKLRYSFKEQVYKVTRATTGEVDIDGFIDELVVSDSGFATITFSVGSDD